MAVKQAKIQIDLEELNRQLEDQREQALLDPGEISAVVRTTVFSLGSDPRVGTEPIVKPPVLRYVEILRDGLNNPFVRVHWRILRQDVELGGVIYFNVFRRKIKPFKKIREFGRLAYDRVSQGIPRRGHFGEERKGITQIKPDALPATTLNHNNSLQFPPTTRQSEMPALRSSIISNGSLAGIRTTPPKPIINEAQFANFLNDKAYAKVAKVNYGRFAAKQRRSFVTVTDNEFVDLYFDDKSVRFGDAVEYYVVSVSKSISDSLQSDKVKVQLEDTTAIHPPSQVMVKQLIDNSAAISICVDPVDEIDRAIVLRRSDADLSFKVIGAFTNVRDRINFVDATIEYGGEYTYRVFLENIHGTLSEPVENTLFASTQRTLPRSRSNVFKVPILTTIQDQNSDFIKITISANDPKVAYYEIHRKNLSTKERKFSMVSRENNYGGIGWRTNQLFVDRQRDPTSSPVDSNRQPSDTRNIADIANTQTSVRPLSFVDDTAQLNQVYQYRIIGYDLFRNSTPAQFSTIRAVGKKSLRSPVNVRITRLRGHPLRVKLEWDDDNEVVRYSEEEVFRVPNSTAPEDLKVVYEVQRRKLAQKRYEYFPTTANNFLIDEVETDDAIPFAALKIEDVYGPQPNRIPLSQSSFLSDVSPLTTTPSLTSLSPSSILVAPQDSTDSTAALSPTPAGATVIPTNEATHDSGTVLTHEIESLIESQKQGFFGTIPRTRAFGMPSFLQPSSVYFYRVATKSNLEDSNFSEEVKIRSFPDLSNPLDFRADIIDSKVRPLIVKLSWTTDPQQSYPDRWIIERKVDVETDTFEFLGTSYLSEEFFDRTTVEGNSYIYRIKSLDISGGESNFFEARLSV